MGSIDGRGTFCAVRRRANFGGVVAVGMIRCAMCGAEVERTGSRQKYCHACAYKAMQERQKARRHYKHKHITKTKIIKCVVCGREVEVNACGGMAKYCETCASMAYKVAQDRSNRKRREMARGVCCVCGEEFDYISINGYERKCCDGCRTRSNVKDRGIIYKPKQDSKPKPKASGASIENLATAARAKGMSYGQYKAWLYMEQQKEKA